MVIAYADAGGCQGLCLLIVMDPKPAKENIQSVHKGYSGIFPAMEDPKATELPEPL